jgi:hypothetical protein
MARAVSCWRLTAEAPVRARVGFVLDKVAVAQIFLSVFRFPLSISFHRGSPCSYIFCGMNSAAVHEQSHPIDMNNKNINKH